MGLVYLGLGWYIERWDWFTWVYDRVKRDGTGLPRSRMVYRETELVYLDLGWYIERWDWFT